MIAYTNSLIPSAGILPPAASTADFVSYETKTTVKIAGNFSKPTLLQFGALQKAYDYFNAFLFSGSLPPVMLVLCRGGHQSATCYIPGAWTDDLDNSISQIKINPATLLIGPARNVYARLVHEMCHHWQHNSGKPGRNGYHNKEFAAKMKSLGLQCTSNGKANGKPTGQHITELILEDGSFDSAYACLPTDFILPFRPSAGNHRQQHSNMLMTTETHASKNKIKYSCPACGLNVWGKPGIRIRCEADMLPLESA
jgi:hypothetical protein